MIFAIKSSVEFFSFLKCDKRQKELNGGKKRQTSQINFFLLDLKLILRNSMKTNKYVLFLLKFLIFSLVFYVLFHSNINSQIYPFAFGLLYAATWANQKVWIVVPGYVLAGALFLPSLENTICILVCCFALLLPYFVHVISKKNMRKWEFFLFAIVGQTANLAFELVANVHPLLSCANLILGLLFMYACMIVLEAFVIRGFTNKLTSLEIVSFFSIIAVFCDGLTSISFFNFSFLKFFVCFALFLFAFCSTPLLTLLLATTCGIGSFLCTNNPIFVAPFLLWAISMILFKKTKKIFMVISLISTELLIGFYFKFYESFGWLEMLPSLIAGLIFMAVPKSWCDQISVIFNLSQDRIAMRNSANRNREILHRRLGNLSEVFNDMNNLYRGLLKRGMSIEDVKLILGQEITEKICSFCPERNHCLRVQADSTKKVFDELITLAFEKGKVSLLDIPSFLASRCKQTGSILGSVNTLTAQYKKYIDMVHDVDTSKLIIAEQLLGVSKVMSSLSKEVESSITFDTVKENKISDELTYYNIVCIDVVVYEKDLWTMEVSVVVKNEDSERPRIADVVSRVCGKRMAPCEIFACSRPGYSVVCLKTAPLYDCLFAVAQKAKNGSKVSGDTYTAIKLDSDKMLFAISDGMGSGERAEKTSELSINLIENFYRAGFDNDLILSTTNKLLNLYKDEAFSALDLSVVDLKNGVVDFVKMASPISLILNTEECKVVKTGSLPIGIVENSQPLVQKSVIKEKDFLILFSDGIADSFKNEDQLRECVMSIQTKNPQELADQILERALACNNGYAVDDMTVLVIKILNF